MNCFTGTEGGHLPEFHSFLNAKIAHHQYIPPHHQLYYKNDLYQRLTFLLAGQNVTHCYKWSGVTAATDPLLKLYF